VRLYPRAALLLWIALAAGSAWWVGRHARFSDELTAFLPASGGRAERLLVEQVRAGAASRTVLIAIEGGEPGRRADVSRALARALAADPRFGYVTNGSAEFARAARQFALEHRYFLSPGVDAERFSEESLRRALRESVEQLSSLSGIAFKPTLARDPTGELRRIAETAGQAAPPLRHGVWFSGDGERALLLAQTAAPGTDAVRQQGALDAISDAFARAGAGPEVRLVLSGPGVFAARTRAAIEHDARWLTGIAGALVVLILVLVHRSARTVTLSVLPVLTGLLAGVAAVALVFGSVHGITLAFGATLIGEAVDYPSYVFTQRRPGETVLDVLGRVWPTLRLAVLTTVFGSLTLLLSSLQGLSQLGVLSMTGVLSAGLVTRWVLPALAPGTLSEAPRALPFSLVRVGLAMRRAAWLAWALLAVALAFIALRHDRIWDDDLAHLSPLPQSVRDLDQQLRAELRAPDVRFLLIVAAPSREAALAASEQAAVVLQEAVRDGVLDGFDLAARTLPGRQTQERRRAALPDPRTLRAALSRAMQGLPFRSGAFAPFQRDVEAARRAPLLTPEDLRGTGLDLKVQSLLQEEEGGGEWQALIPLREVRDPARLRALLEKPSAGARATFLDLKAESDRLVAGYRFQALALAGVGALAIAVLLYAGLRRVGEALRVMLPVYAAIAMTVACLVAFGGGLSLFHLVSLLLVLGIGLNYALFFNQAEPGTEREQGTSLALSVCFLTTFAAFGCLATSRIPVLSAIGLTVTLGCALSLVNAMILGRPRTGIRGK
jgi:predicted exporter